MIIRTDKNVFFFLYNFLFADWPSHWDDILMLSIPSEANSSLSSLKWYLVKMPTHPMKRACAALHYIIRPNRRKCLPFTVNIYLHICKIYFKTWQKLYRSKRKSEHSFIKIYEKNNRPLIWWILNMNYIGKHDKKWKHFSHLYNFKNTLKQCILCDIR